MAFRQFILFAAAALGLIGIGQSFRSDEVWTLHTIAQPFPAMMEQLRADIHPPLYYLLLRPWTAVAGTSEFGARSLSWLFHALAGVAVYATARRRIGADRAAVCAAVFLASPLGIVAAQLVRMYSLLELTAALSILCWLRFAESDQPDRRALGGFIAVSIAGTFTHVWFFFLLAGIAATHLILWRTRRLGFMALAAACTLLPYAVLWLPVMLRQAGRAADNLAWMKAPAWTAPAEVLWMQLGVALLLLAAGRSWRALDRATLLLWLTTIGIPFALSLIVQPLFWARFTVVALPALAIAAGTWISGRLTPRTTLLATVLGAGALTVALAAARSDACDARWTAHWLQTNTGTGDIVLFTNLSRLPVEHYLQASVAATRQSFPLAIDSHPGYEGRIDLAAFDTELHALTAELIVRHTGRQLVLMHGFDPENHARLTKAFDDRFERIPAACVRCSAMPNYYREITVWRIAPRTELVQSK